MIYKSIFTIPLLLLMCVVCGQPIKVSLHPQSPTTFYEGQYIEIILVVENTTKDTILCNYGQIGSINKVLDAAGQEVTNENYEAYQVFKSHATQPPVIDKCFDLFPPKSKLQLIKKVSYFFNSNAALEDPETKRETRYGYLMKGKYTLVCDLSIEGYSTTYQFPIEILAPTGELMERFKALGTAMFKAESAGLPPSHGFVCDTLQPTILNFLLKYKDGPYVETAHKYPFTGMNNSASRCTDISYYGWKFLNMLPQIFEGKEWMTYSENFYASMFVDNLFCKFEPSVDNKEGYINAYLKKIENFSPRFCDKIIAQAGKCCDRTKLVNYAQLRELQNQKSKKSAR